MNRSTAGRRRRRFRRRLRSDRRGVVSVVGTLLALLVFFSLFGVFLTQYVPLWMSENEQALATQLQTAFANLKVGVDEQVDSSAGTPAVVATPFPIQSSGIPLIAQPTTASLTFVPPGSSNSPYTGVTIVPAPGSTSVRNPFVENATQGRFQVNVPARYYSPETFSFEDDAVIQSQGSGQQVVEFPPAISVNQSGTGYGLTVIMVVLTGSSVQATGTGTQEVFTHFVFSTPFVATNATQGLSATFVEGTFYPCAWGAFASSTLSTGPAGFSSHYAVGPTGSCTSPLTTPYPFKVTFSHLASITLIYAEVRLVVGLGTE